jgi:transcriptional regulator with XRE-family HTH domain
MTTFADLLREKRLSKGYTQERLAHRCGVAHATLAVWERGGTSPNIVCLKLLAEALKVPLQSFLECEFPVDHRLKGAAVHA